MATAAEMVVAIDNAIYAIMNGNAVKSYGTAGRNLDRYSLQELRDMRREYQALANAEAGGGAALQTVAGFRDAE